MDCHYYDAGVCRSCTRMGMPYADQLRDKQSAAAAVLAAHVAPAAWRDPFAGTESGFRNKAKLVTGGAPGEVTVGILDARGRGVDLRDCGLYEAPLQAAMTPVVRIVEDLRLLPYDVP
ncbi:MAG: 23S rRNA (uracil(747)-C(5))-methyltransferase, partial [Tetrasphaera sp.]|nr:23S rRNA (uracil(747)-C(5))-methyltransferase [Tetrasphaera sp.]